SRSARAASRARAARTCPGPACPASPPPRTPEAPGRFPGASARSSSTAASDARRLRAPRAPGPRPGRRHANHRAAIVRAPPRPRQRLGRLRRSARRDAGRSVSVGGPPTVGGGARCANVVKRPWSSSRWCSRCWAPSRGRRAARASCSCGRAPSACSGPSGPRAQRAGPGPRPPCRRGRGRSDRRRSCRPSTPFLASANGSYALYDPSGAPALGPGSYAALFRLPVGTESFGARVVYDQYRRTFVLAFLAVNRSRHDSWILLVAIPDATATDASTWCGTRIVADRLAGDGPQWADEPALGYDLGRVTLATDMRAFGRQQPFAYAQVLSIPKTALYDCDRRLTFDTVTGRATRNPDGTQAFGLRPAASAGPHPSVQYLVSFEPRASAIVLWRLRSSGT